MNYKQKRQFKAILESFDQKSRFLARYFIKFIVYWHERRLQKNLRSISVGFPKISRLEAKFLFINFASASY